MAMTVAPRRVRLLDPAEALRAGADAVGGKAHGLARLAGAGVRVPAWFVLPATLFDEHLRAAGLDGAVREGLASLERDSARDIAAVSATIRSLIDQTPIDEELSLALRESCASLSPGPLAVRSSAIDEDGDRHSFAGQLETVLGVEGDDALMDAIRCCWSSAFSERVLDYRLRAGSLGNAARVAVIVQSLIDGDVSGVMFTADPMAGSVDWMRISACPGLGDGLVSGEIDADEYLIDRKGTVVQSRLRDEDTTPLLDAAMLEALARAGAAIEAAEGSPRDIEWTMSGSQLWILQARPITSIASALPAIVWDNSNIQESYCGVTTPLTFSFARAAYASVYEQTMRAVGIPERIIAEHRTLLRNLLGLIHGRVYYNLNNWYRGLLLLPAFHRNKADMERMMGVEEPVDFVTDEAVATVEKIRRLPRLLRTLGRLSVRFVTLERDTARFLADFDATIRDIDRSSLNRRSPSELMRVLDRLQRECLDRWTTPIINDFYVMMAVGRLRRFVVRGVGADVDGVMQTLLGGADVTISAAPALLMLEMADAARRGPAAVSALLDLEGSAALREAATLSPDFARAYTELVDDFGDRCMGELKLESRPLRDDPEFVVGVLRNYLGGAAEATLLGDRGRMERERTEYDVSRRLTGVARWPFRRSLRTARRAIRARETMRLARTRLFGTYRDTYRAIGAHLCAMGRLVAIDDIFYLTVEEIEGFWNGTAVSTDLRPIVSARRREFAAFESIDAPNRIIQRSSRDPEAPRPQPPAVEHGKAVLHGLGCSPGIAQARVRIVTGPSGDLALAGHILVATRTDPGWSPLFPSAAAIVVERGSVLSHSAVLARELGLPAVVGIPNLTKILRDGELVRVDGTAGTVERLEAPCAS